MQARKNVLIILFLFTAAVACYSTVLNAGFVWDDEYLVLRNPLLRAPLWSFQIFRQDIVDSGFTYTIYYRPIQILSYAVDYRLWGMNPFAFHLSGIFLHFLNSVLVFCLTRKISGKSTVSLLAALLFVIHPAHAGAVSYISSRTDLLFFFFGFLCMLSYVFFVERRRYTLLAASVFFLVLSLLSKEAALVFPFLLLLLDALVLTDRHRFRIMHHLPIFFTAGCYAALHRFLFSQRYSLVFSPGESGAGLVKYFAMVREFIILTLFPFNMHMRRSAGGAEGLIPFFILAGIFFVFLVVRLKNRRRMLLFSLGFFHIALIPFLFVAGYFEVFAEHWMYLASYGIFVFMAVTFVWIYRHAGLPGRIMIPGLILACVICFSANTIAQGIYWLEDISLSDRVLAFSAQDTPAMHYKAVSYFKSGMDMQSLDIMKEYVKKNSRDPRAWYIKGRLTLAAGRTDEAQQDFRRAIDLQADYDNGYMGLALVAFVKGEDRGGIEYLERAVGINPKHSEALLILGAAYSEAGEDEKALETEKKARKINPYDYNALVNLGTAYSRLGYLQESARCYQEAIRLYPERVKAYYNFGYVFLIGGQRQEAEKWLRKAVMLDPGFTPAIDLLRKMQAGSKAKRKC